MGDGRTGRNTLDCINPPLPDWLLGRKKSKRLVGLVEFAFEYGAVQTVNVTAKHGIYMIFSPLIGYTNNSYHLVSIYIYMAFVGMEKKMAPMEGPHEGVATS